MSISKQTILLLIILLSFKLQAQVGIGTTNPDASAILELNSNNQGFLLPRVSLTSLTDVTTITTPADGLLIYNLTVNATLSKGLYIYNATLNEWGKINTTPKTIYKRLIKDYIGFSNVSITAINGYVFHGPFSSLFNGVDDLNANSFHLHKTSGITTDWGFKIDLSSGTSDKYIIKEIILNGRNDCCNQRVNNILVVLYNNGIEVYRSGVINYGSISRNSIQIPIAIYADEIRILVENGSVTAPGSYIMNFSELEVLATN